MQLLTTRIKRKTFVMAVTATLLTILAWYVNNHVSLDELAIQEERFRAAIALHPWRSFVIGFGVYAGLSLIPGTGGKAIVFAWLFGYWQAMIIVMVGLTSAAMVIFSLSRYLFREYIESRYTSFLSLMNRHIEREGAFYLLTLALQSGPTWESACLRSAIWRTADLARSSTRRSSQPWWPAPLCRYSSAGWWAALEFPSAGVWRKMRKRKKN